MNINSNLCPPLNLIVHIELLAKEFNVNQITISQYERGTRQISLDMLINYAKKFNVSTDYILGLTKNPTPNYDIKNQLNISGQNKIHKIEMK